MDSVMMFKILVLQSLYNLGDDAAEYLIRDRLSFMRFLGLGLADWYRKDFYEKAPDRNPKGPAKGAARVLRGGSWYTDDPWDLGASGRQRITPGFWDDDIGFRCAKGAN